MQNPKPPIGALRLGRFPHKLSRESVQVWVGSRVGQDDFGLSRFQFQTCSGCGGAQSVEGGGNLGTAAGKHNMSSRNAKHRSRVAASTAAARAGWSATENRSGPSGSPC